MNDWRRPLLDGYLRRLGVDVDGREPDAALLAELQVAHLLEVPFENLDVYHRRHPRTGVDWSLPKLVERGRGGWCFELNGAFGWLLGELGFRVDYVSCRVFGNGQWGPPLDHCALVVHLEGARLLVDVGFGDCCMVPVALADGEHDGIPRRVRVAVDGDQFRTAELGLDEQWTDTLWGNFDPLTLDAFTPRSEHLQTEPGLAWSEKPFATRATAADGSRITLRDGLLRVRRGAGTFDDTTVAPDDWPALLAQHFRLDEA